MPIYACPYYSSLASSKRILCYLQGTITLCLHFSPTNKTSLLSFLDAAWLSDADDSRSQYVFSIYHSKNLISWASCKQKVVARSSTKAEYRALTHTAAELIWLKQLLFELHMPITCAPLLLYGNVSTIFMTQNLVICTRSKHIALDFHFVKEQIEAKELHISHVSSVDQHANIFTKPLHKDQFHSLCNKLQVCPGHELSRG